MHSLLKRQLRRFSLEMTQLGASELKLLQAINEAYWTFETEHNMLAQRLQLTSQELLKKIAELSKIRTALETRVALRTAELSQSEERFRGLFEHAPVSIWEEDFSAVREYVDELSAAGVRDFPAYFEAHPEAILECLKLVKVVDVNRATLDMYQAEDKAQLVAELVNIVGTESLEAFQQEVLAMIRGDLKFEAERTNWTLRGESRFIFLRLIIAPGYEHSWAKVFVSISDITRRREAETALAAERDLLQALMDNIPDGIYFKDPSLRFVRINQAQARVLGLASPDEAIGKTNLDFQNEQTARGFMGDEERIVQTGEPLVNRLELHPTSDGKPRWFSATIVPIRDETGCVTGLVGVSRDITERKLFEEALRQSEERFKLMAWATMDAVWDWDLERNHIWWGEGLKKNFHYSDEAAQSSPAWREQHIHPDDRPKVGRAIRQALEGGMEFWSKEYRFQRKDGSYADLMDRGYILRDDAGKPVRMIGAMLDISDRKQMESRILQTNEELRQSLEELRQRNEEIVLLNEMSRLLQGCQSQEEAYAILGNLAVQLFPHTAGALYLLNSPRTLAIAAAVWGELPTVEKTFPPNTCWALRSGRTHPLNGDGEDEPSHCLHLVEPLETVSSCLPIQVGSEIIGTLHVQSRDPEHLNEAKRQLAYNVVEQAGMALSNLKLRDALREQSIRDPLTGLYNRRYMEEALRQQLRRVTRGLHPLGIIMIDIDHFKSFNDTYGHAAGDALLRRLGYFLQSHVRGEDIACRYGGEEFLLILPDAYLEAVRQRAEEVLQGVRDLRVRDGGHSRGGITLSIGVAIYPLHGRTIESVLRAADAALYRAKQEGRDRVIVVE